MGLYTAIWEFAGGTYISQVKASSPAAGLSGWAKGLNVAEVSGFGPSGKSQLIALTEEGANEVVAIAGIVNVWCWAARIRKQLMLVNIVKTAVPTVR